MTCGARASGADVEVILPAQEAGGSGALLIPNTVGIIAGGANPAGARRLVDYLLSAVVGSGAGDVIDRYSERIIGKAKTARTGVRAFPDAREGTPFVDDAPRRASGAAPRVESTTATHVKQHTKTTRPRSRWSSSRSRRAA